MKKAFSNDNNTVLWIASAVVGAFAAGAGIWFYLQGKRTAELEASRHEHAGDYLKSKKHKIKKRKTDVSELDDLVHHQRV